MHACTGRMPARRAVSPSCGRAALLFQKAVAYIHACMRAGFKIGKYHHLHQTVPQPDTVDRSVSAADEAALREGVDSYFKGASGRPTTASVCFFTNTPDGHFLVDRHPKYPQVRGVHLLIPAALCTGHGCDMQ